MVVFVLDEKKGVDRSSTVIARDTGNEGNPRTASPHQSLPACLPALLCTHARAHYLLTTFAYIKHKSLFFKTMS